MCSGREANNMLRKLCVYCIPNVYDVVDSDFLEGAYLLQVFRGIFLGCKSSSLYHPGKMSLEEIKITVHANG